MYTCDTCGKSSDTTVIAGRWVFYCNDNAKCKESEDRHILDEVNHLNTDDDVDYALSDGELSEALGNIL